MLLSSIVLGVVSDRFGRMRCIQFGFFVSMFSTIAAIVARNYTAFNVIILLTSFAQVGVTNALCTLGEFALPPLLLLLSQEICIDDKSYRQINRTRTQSLSRARRASAACP